MIISDAIPITPDPEAIPAEYDELAFRYGWAVREIAKARVAIQRLVRLDPNHPGLAPLWGRVYLLRGQIVGTHDRFLDLISCPHS